MKSGYFSSIFVRFFIFILGLIMVLPALNTLYTYCSYRYMGNTTIGVIDHPSSGRDLGGRPLIKYTDVPGNVHVFKRRAKTHLFQTPQKGEKIQLFIHKSDPQKAIVNNLLYYILLPLIFLAGGCYCCLYAILNKNYIYEDKKEIGYE